MSTELGALAFAAALLHPLAVDLFIGTSGYSYKEWRGSFYPEDLGPDEWLAFYASQLPAVCFGKGAAFITQGVIGRL